MEIIHSDAIFRVEPGTSPNYNRENPLLKLLESYERVQLAAAREFYLADHLQVLVPFEHLDLWGPAGDTEQLDPELQDDKTDFQKQNVRDFRASDTHLVRGWMRVGSWTGPFLRLSYRGGPDSLLSETANHALGDAIKVWVEVGGRSSGVPLQVPYNPQSDRYEVEIWGYPGGDLRDRLDPRGREALDRGEIQVRNDLMPGNLADFERKDLDERYMVEVAPDNPMHPILPLRVQLAWADHSERFWDSRSGANHQYEFSMVLRGWDHFLGVGISPNPHGGIGFLEYRNLLSNYGRYAGRPELSRELEPWNFDALGRKDHGGRTENFLAVEYMDLHVLNPDCGIGLHRHRDNQEAFLMLEGRGLMVIGDWALTPRRERCFEIRTLRAGHLALLKGGNLHGLMNAGDENISLFMFGGYD